MIVQLEITRYVHHPETSIELREERDACTMQFGDFLPAIGDRIHTEEGESYRVTGRTWLPGGLLLIVEQRVVDGEQPKEAA